MTRGARLSLYRGLALALLLAACGDDATTRDADADTGTAEVGDTDSDVSDVTDSADEVDAPTEVDAGDVDDFLELVGRYNLLVTVAGRGQQRDEGAEWASAYEGGPAVGAELSRPHMAMADDAGLIYIADKEAHAIRRVDHDGVITTVAGTNTPGDDGDSPGPGTARRLSNPNGLWVRGDGTVYILDLDNGKVRRLDEDGTLSTLFVVPGGITSGRGLWVSDDERHAFVASGSRLLEWRAAAGVSELARGFGDLGNLALDPAGRLVVTDRAGHRVYRLDAEGLATPIAGNGTTEGGGDGALALDSGLDEPRAVWFMPSGGFFVGTHEGNQVWYVDTRGVLHLFLDGGDNHAHGGDGLFFRAPGKKVSEVRAITVDKAGRILVTENDFGYVRAVLPAGWPRASGR